MKISKYVTEQSFAEGSLTECFYGQKLERRTRVHSYNSSLLCPPSLFNSGSLPSMGALR